MDSAKKRVNRKSSKGSGSSIPDNGRVGSHGKSAQVDDDSPYSSPNSLTVEQSSLDNKDSPGWDDTSVYNAKKVTLIKVYLHIVFCVMN